MSRLMTVLALVSTGVLAQMAGGSALAANRPRSGGVAQPPRDSSTTPADLSPAAVGCPGIAGDFSGIVTLLIPTPSLALSGLTLARTWAIDAQPSATSGCGPGPSSTGLALNYADARQVRRHLMRVPSTIAPGWPVFLGTSGNGQSYTPALFDIDGDGTAEIFVHGGGDTFALRGNGSLLSGWPTSDQYLGMGTQGQLPGPSVGDLDGDGIADVVWAFRDWSYGSFHTYAFNARRLDGSNVSGFPQAAPVEGALAPFIPFVTGDTGGLGFRAAAAGFYVPPAQVTFFAARGAARTTFSFAPDEWLISLHFGDLDGDGQGEFFAVSWNETDESISLHAFDPEGREKTGYPRVLVAPHAFTLITGPPLAADLDGDGDLEILLQWRVGSIDCFHHDARRCNGFPIRFGYPIQVWGFCVGNLAGGASADHLVILGWDTSESVYRLLALGIATGTLLPGWPVTLPGPAHPAAIAPGVPIIFDADGDGEQDICISHIDGGLYVFSGEGRLFRGYPQWMKSPSISGTAVGDIDGDGLFEIVAATWDGWVYAWKTPSPAREDRADWPMRGGNARNTGVSARRGSLPAHTSPNATSVTSGMERSRPPN